MAKICKECGKNAYRTDVSAITVALRCSRARGTALRVYRCPHQRVWHLTNRTTWSASSGAMLAATGVGYHSLMAAVLTDRITVDEADLVKVAATTVEPQLSLSATRWTVDTWFNWGLVYPKGPTITAVDVEALLKIAEQGWHQWLSSRPTYPAISGVPYGL